MPWNNGLQKVSGTSIKKSKKWSHVLRPPHISHTLCLSALMVGLKQRTYLTISPHLSSVSVWVCCALQVEVSHWRERVASSRCYGIRERWERVELGRTHLTPTSGTGWAVMLEFLLKLIAKQPRETEWAEWEKEKGAGKKEKRSKETWRGK